MADHHSSLVLIAELSVAIAGFAGVAAAFGGRDRAYLPIERDRLKALFTFAFTTLATSLAALSLPGFDPIRGNVELWSTALGALLWIPVAIYFFRVTLRNYFDPDSSTTAAPVAIVVVGTTFPAVAYAASLSLGGHASFFELALSGQLLFALWVFVRLMIHRT